MTPDKIYVHVRTEPRPSITFSEALEENSLNVEYIRKDALLGWAKKKNQRIDTGEGDYSLGYVSAMIDLIDKLNSM